MQAMSGGGKLRVFVREATDWARQRRGMAISILDTGVGIRPEDARRLFQPFFSTKSTKGTGLGLWISKGIVQKYDGSLTCRSFRTRIGCCTCFRVFLPIAGASGIPAPSASDSQKQDQELSQVNHRAWQTV
jgi:signal transduction histidine kinase